MRKIDEARAFIGKMFHAVDLPPPRVLLRAKRPTMFAASDFSIYTICIFGLPVSKSTCRHEVFEMVLSLATASQIAAHQVIELAERGAAR